MRTKATRHQHDLKHVHVRIVRLTVVRTSLRGVHFNDPIVSYDQLSTAVLGHNFQSKPKLQDP